MLPPFQPSNSRNFSIVNGGLPMIILNYSNSKAIVQIPPVRHGYRGIFHCCSRNSLEKRRDDCNLAPYLKTKPKSLRRAVFFKKPEKKISSYIYFFNSPSRNPISRIEGSYLYSLTSPKQSVAEKNLSLSQRIVFLMPFCHTGNGTEGARCHLSENVQTFLHLPFPFFLLCNSPFFAYRLLIPVPESIQFIIFFFFGKKMQVFRSGFELELAFIM